MVYVTVRKILFPLVKSKLTISGGQYLPRRAPYLLAANHIDWLDGFVIAGAVLQERGHAVYFLTKSKNYWWTRATLPINPQERSQSIADALQYLQSGKIICNFIEGQRNPSRILASGKTGTARLALWSGLPVIPVGLTGPSGKTFAHSLANFTTDPTKILVRFGPPVDLDVYRKKSIDYKVLTAATDEIMHALEPLTGKEYVA